jgi:hypothetical protein
MSGRQARSSGKGVMHLALVLAAFSVLAWGQISGRAGAATACTTPIKTFGCDATLVDTIEAATAKDCYNFAVPNIPGGTRVHLSVIEGDPSQTNFQPSWRVVTTQGGTTPGCGGFDTKPERDCGPLAGAGSGTTYRLEVQDHQNNATGTYRVHLQYLTTGITCHPMSIICDTPKNVTIETPVDTDLLTFTVPDLPGGTRVHIKAKDAGSPPAGTPSWRLLSKTGAPVPGNCALFVATNQRDCGPLAYSGNPYRIEVQDRGRDQIATQRFYFQALTQGATCETGPAINPCIVLSGKINSQLDSDLFIFNFTVANNARVRINMTEVSPGFDLAWRLLTKTGAPLSASSTCSVFTSSAQKDCGPLPASGNPYRIEVQGFQGDDTGDYQARVCPL